MPRLKPKPTPPEKATREQLIRQMADGVEYPDVSNELLKDVPESERAGLVEQALELAFTERAASRRPILMERLQTWPPMALGNIFAADPGLLDTLSDEQRARWEAWRAAYGAYKAKPYGS